MTFYEELIIASTGCAPEDAEEIEDYMRDTIFHSTLDWQDKFMLETAANQAYGDILFMRSPEGIAYCKQLNDQILNYHGQ